MASGIRMLTAGLALITNTIIIMLFALAGGAVFGPIYSWLSQQDMGSHPVVSANLVQWFPGVFFGMLLVLEIVLIYVVYQTAVVSRTYYREY